MHAHFLVDRRGLWWMWLSLCAVGPLVSGQDAQIGIQGTRGTETAVLPETGLPETTPTRQDAQAPLRGSAVFAGGCFWCIESDLEKVPGVIEAISGYSGGRTKNPTYETYASGGHREVVFVVYDPSQITYAGLVEYLIKHVDPTNRVGQFQDQGRQYGPAIYYIDEEERVAAQRVVNAISEMKIFRRRLNVVIEPRQAFWPAEAYHQDFHVKNLAKYQFYRSASGRDAFLQQHWGARSSQLELEGAYPLQGSDTGVNREDPTSMITNAASPDARFKNRGLASDNQVGSSSELVKSPSSASPAEPAWVNFKKPSPQALRQKLTTQQFRVTQHDDTEPAFQNRYWNNHAPGIYVDIVSGEPLFSSADKFDSGTGWPSFVAPIDPQAVRYAPDNKLSYMRIDVRSSRGDSHLGHLFNDGPVQRGGKRYCLNSASLRFVPKEAMQREGYAEYLPLVGE